MKRWLLGLLALLCMVSMVTYLPTKAITLPVNGSVRILKGSAKQVKKIRNITKLLD